MKIRTLIVDDEPPARVKLRRWLAAEEDIEIVGEAANGDEAIRLIGGLRPDLLFLDVQMPGQDGLAVLRAVRDVWLPCTVFTTAYAEHAVEAFALHAIDYLLKPFNHERFVTALDRMRERLERSAGRSDERVDALLQHPAVTDASVERFLVKEGERYIVVRAAAITWIEAAANYAVLHTPAGNYVLRRTLAALEAELDARRFFRTSRSAIVNLDNVGEVRVAGAGEHVILLHDGQRVPLTRGLRELQERLRTPREN